MIPGLKTPGIFYSTSRSRGPNIFGYLREIAKGSGKGKTTT